MSRVNYRPERGIGSVARTRSKKLERPGAAGRPARERRRSERLPLAIPVFARGLDPQGKEFLEFTTTINVSAGGALLLMRRSLPTGSKVFLEIPAAPLPRVTSPPKLTRTLQGEIARVTPSDPSYLWAIRFDQPVGAN